MVNKRKDGNKCDTIQDSGDLGEEGKGYENKETQKRHIFWGENNV